MKKNIITIVLTVCWIFSHGQEVARKTLASSGGYYEGTTRTHSWTIGQLVTTTLQSGNHILTQGFQQPDDIILLALRVDIKALLDGPYQPDTGLMGDNLRAAGYIPLTEPYSGLFVHHPPGGGEKIDTTVLLVSGNNAIIDWVFIELRDKADSTVVISTRSALIQADGDIVDIDGISPLAFNNVQADEYYIAVRHLNHLGVMTGNPIALSDAVVTIDFTDQATNTYGTNAAQKMATNGKMVMWSGEVVSDGFLKYSGINNDRDKILLSIGGVIPTSTLSGYYKEDVNRDGIVKYSGLENDRDIILFNIGGSAPTNVLVEQLPE